MKQMRRLNARERPAERPAWRPRTRSDCANACRPCPWVGCRHHLWTDVRQSGSIAFAHGDVLDYLLAMPETCALDVADRGPHSNRTVARLLGISRQRVDMIMQDAVAALRDVADQDEGVLAPPAAAGVI